MVLTHKIHVILLPILPKKPTRLLNLRLPIRKIPPHNRRILTTAYNPSGIELQLEHTGIGMRGRGMRHERVVGVGVGWIRRLLLEVGGELGLLSLLSLGSGGRSAGRGAGRRVHDLLDV